MHASSMMNLLDCSEALGAGRKSATSFQLVVNVSCSLVHIYCLGVLWFWVFKMKTVLKFLVDLIDYYTDLKAFWIKMEQQNSQYNILCIYLTPQYCLVYVYYRWLVTIFFWRVPKSCLSCMLTLTSKLSQTVLLLLQKGSSESAVYSTLVYQV